MGLTTREAGRFLAYLQYHANLHDYYQEYDSVMHGLSQNRKDVHGCLSGSWTPGLTLTNLWLGREVWHSLWPQVQKRSQAWNFRVEARSVSWASKAGRKERAHGRTAPSREWNAVAHQAETMTGRSAPLPKVSKQIAVCFTDLFMSRRVSVPICSL